MNWPRPKQLLVKCGHQWPMLWKYVDLARAERGGELPRWPDWCYLSTSAGVFLMQRVCPLVNEAGMSNSFDSVESFSRMVVPLATWRVTQGIYRIDPEVAEAVWNTPIDGHLPVELLFHLPEWCVYIETPGRSLSSGKYLEGFFAHLNTTSGTHDPELRLLLDDPAGILHSIAVPLLAATLEEACRIASIDRTNYDRKICWSNGAAAKIADERMAASDPTSLRCDGADYRCHKNTSFEADPRGGRYQTQRGRGGGTRKAIPATSDHWSPADPRRKNVKLESDSVTLPWLFLRLRT